MASIEIQLNDFLMPEATVRDGRRVVVLPSSNGDEAVLVIPRGGDGALRRIGLVLERLADEAKAAERGDVHRGGKVVASASWPAG